MAGTMRSYLIYCGITTMGRGLGPEPALAARRRVAAPAGPAGAPRGSGRGAVVGGARGARSLRCKRSCTPRRARARRCGPELVRASGMGGMGGGAVLRGAADTGGDTRHPRAQWGKGRWGTRTPGSARTARGSGAAGLHGDGGVGLGGRGRWPGGRRRRGRPQSGWCGVVAALSNRRRERSAQPVEKQNNCA